MRRMQAADEIHLESGNRMRARASVIDQRTRDL